VRRHSAIDVDDDLAPGQACVRGWSARDEARGGVEDQQPVRGPAGEQLAELQQDDDFLEDGVAKHSYVKPLIDYSFPVTVLPGSTELEAVCMIFETLNRTGKPLTPFELISARAFAGGVS
jgi:hypothetical protein